MSQPLVRMVDMKTIVRMDDIYNKVGITDKK